MYVCHLCISLNQKKPDKMFLEEDKTFITNLKVTISSRSRSVQCNKMTDKETYLSTL